MTRKVIFDHDGGIDDLISLLLLLRLPDIEVVGVLITPADCYPDDALKSTRLLLSLTGNADIPVAVGTLCGPNPFPPDWRAQPRVCHSLPLMLRTKVVADNVSEKPAHQWLADYLADSGSAVTVVMTGPATNLAAVINTSPECTSAIDEVIWMGGAVSVRGNVAMHDHNGSAEWNAYWDPNATKTLIDSGLNLLLVPLDATNALPVDRDFLIRLAQQHSPVSDLAGQFWAATVTAIPSYEFTYFLWDVLSVSMLALPSDSYRERTAPLVAETATPKAGQTRIDDRAGRPTRWVSEVDAGTVIALVLHYLSGEFDKKPVPFVKSML
ncbi:nucleoside hydrolase [Alteromonas sp. CYL-A6]|uniref:nucleoside hydrolase n=1 Tax=Alteromonas nitratireducens TaxID=3390813 RepID=UPI0034C1BB9F